jgi:hypothetical protein
LEAENAKACRIAGLSRAALYREPTDVIERSNRTVGHDWLAQKLFGTMDDVRAATRCMLHYNHERPNIVSGGITPNQWLTIAA